MDTKAYNPYHDIGDVPLNPLPEPHENNDDDTPLPVRKDFRVPTKIQPLASPSTYIPPAGYALAELLPGRAIRLTALTAEPRPWAPGQHFLISIPSVNKFTSQPFIVSSVYDQLSPNPVDRVLVFLIRWRVVGWTKTLWKKVIALSAGGKFHCDGEKPPEGTCPPSRGVLLRVSLKGPFGSVARTDWVGHSSVLLVVGGSGVCFAMSMLVYLCLCLAGRSPQSLGGPSKSDIMRVSTVHLIWLVGEFGKQKEVSHWCSLPDTPSILVHLSWCAPVLRRCIALAPDSLRISIFVTAVPKLPQPVPLGPAEHPVTPNALGTAGTRYTQDNLRAALVPEDEEMGSLLGNQDNDEEVEDLLTIAEHCAQPGRPKIDMLLKEGVTMAKGPVIIGCQCSLPIRVPQFLVSDPGLSPV